MCVSVFMVCLRVWVRECEWCVCVWVWCVCECVCECVGVCGASVSVVCVCVCEFVSVLWVRACVCV